MPKLVLDASLIISWCVEFHDPVIFDKLLEAGYEPLIPEQVADEVETENPITEHVFRNSELVECKAERHNELSNRFFRLGSGEIAVLTEGEALGKSSQDYFCVLDDRLARQAAKKLELEYTGTIGLMAILVRNDFIEFERADELIQEMKDMGTRLPDNHNKLLRANI